MRLQETEGTIVARSTPAGVGAVAVIRMSGPEAGAILRSVSRCRAGDPVKQPRRMLTASIVDSRGATLDEVLVVFFPGPNSYTGEDLAEIHCHGGEVVVEAVLGRLIESGARPAYRGEFTRRAYEAGKLDLSRAEAVLRVIEAGTREQLTAAIRSLGGSFEAELERTRGKLEQLLAHIEAYVDFPDEPEAGNAPMAELEPVLKAIEELVGSVRRRVDPDCEVVIAGRPNVGKSSLINAIAGRPVSIVTSVPGTTRDAVTTGVIIGGMKVALVDTAGSGENGPTGTIEEEAARVAKMHISRAGMVIWVTEPSDEGLPDSPEMSCPLVWAVNKSDLIPKQELARTGEEIRDIGGVLVSAATGQGIGMLLSEVSKKLSQAYGPSDGVPVTIRQEALLTELREATERAKIALENKQVELAAADIRDALAAVGGLLGDNVEVEVLDRIFEEFCIGK